jgi:2-oxoglutarate ferredoxin oxidoreductase subunit alpha
MNPAALKTNVKDLKPGGLIIADSGEFTAQPRQGEYEASPLEDGSLAQWQVMAFQHFPADDGCVKPFGLGNKEALRCKNMWTLGLALWMFDREPRADRRLAQGPSSPRTGAGRCQYRRAERGPCLWRDGGNRRPGRPLPHIMSIAAAQPQGLYRTITGADASPTGCCGCAACGCRCSSAAIRSRQPLRSCIILSNLKEFGVTTFQAEDEIAAIASAIGASYAGQLGVTSRPAPASR